MRDERSKRQKLDEILLLLRDHPEGLRRADVARRVDIGRSDITKYLDGNDLPEVYEDGGLLKLNRRTDLVRMVLDRDEITALHVAMRLLVHHTNQHNPHVASALRKLSAVTAPRDGDVSAAMIAAAGRADEPDGSPGEFVNSLRALTEARTKRQVVTCDYETENGTLVNYTFEPYFIEPYGAGLTTHVIGRRTPPGALRTFKVERLRNVTMGPQRYEIPADFDPGDLLTDAWGIWYTSEPPVEVEVLFSARVRRRVLETRWHRNQQPPEVLPDGRVRWRCDIAEPAEMVPWLRGWGPDVEVIKPLRLREAVRADARGTFALYFHEKRSAEANHALGPLLSLWGKTGRNGDFHPALFHMLDVGGVARTLLAKDAPGRWRRILAQALNCNEAALEGVLPFWIALHDLGKLSPAFQRQNDAQWARVLGNGFDAGVDVPTRYRHEVVSAAALRALVPDAVPAWVREAIAGHHGNFTPRADVKTCGEFLKRESAVWQTARADAVALLRTTLCVADAQPFEPANLSVAIMALTGFMILCDWIGSDERFFAPASMERWDDYLDMSRRRAQDAVAASGLLVAATSQAPVTASELLADLGSPRPLQRIVDQVPDEVLAEPTVCVIEAPTGEGKTEAALLLARRIARLHGEDTLFYALPTMATSNQMFGRVQEHLTRRLGLDQAVKLAHGQAGLVEEDLRKEAEAWGIAPMEGGDATRSGWEAIDWFGGRKRALLAPFGVGTVDQIELAALRAKHVALRMVGLAGKTVIIDEVHAYDVYMTTILERLLTWLGALGTSVILLSATLPLARRNQLLRAYGARDEAFTDDGYPSLVIAGQSRHFMARPEPVQRQRPIRIEFLTLGDDDTAVAAKADWLVAQSADGGCVCWITNTVRRAQALFEAVRARVSPDVTVHLLHAQMPLSDRLAREVALKAAFGKDPAGRPARAIVVGTQVLEQSLDVDFDAMASDLAPIDLLLQRAGRMHRHQRNRPARHALPVLSVCRDLAEDGTLRQGSDRQIYERYLMLRTQAWLDGLEASTIVLPEDYRRAIEFVYAVPEANASEALQSAHRALELKESRARDEADDRLIELPENDGMFAERVAKRRKLDEDESAAGYFIAQTRLGEESITVVPFEVQEGQLSIGEVRLRLDREAGRDDVLRLMRHQLRISNPDAIAAIRSQKRPTVFTSTALLKEVWPLPLSGGRAEMTTDKGKPLSFILDQHLGLIVRKGERA